MLNVSIVLYQHAFHEVAPLVKTLKQSPKVANIYLLDNSPYPQLKFTTIGAIYIHNSQNLGYGKAHNIAIHKSIEERVKYHLVVNPDIELRPQNLEEMTDYLDNNEDVAHLMPKVFYPNGKIQYLCKLLPTPYDLIFRRFLPKKWTKKRVEYFELRQSGYDKIMNVPYLSGCFMLLRTEALTKVGGFDERFFLYPEDIDLTRRLHRYYKTIFYPHVSVIHHHNQASYKSRKMLWIHIKNMIKYFNKWGWCFDKERLKFNRETPTFIK